MTGIPVIRNIALLLLFIFAMPAAAEDYSAYLSESREKKSGSPFSQSKLIPDISFIADFSGVYRNAGNEAYGAMTTSGVSPASSEMNVDRGFNFNYGELTLQSAVDPYFELFAVFHFGLEHAGIEEAYINSTALPGGVMIRGGKFLSSFGRLNSQHAHSQDFADVPLINGYFFTAEGLGDVGLQVTWTAPLAIYLLAGAEIFRGNNGGSFGIEGYTDLNNDITVKGYDYPELYTGFVKTSFDIDDLTILSGLSGAFGQTRINRSIDEVDGYGLKGKSAVAGIDLTLRYQLDSYRHIAFQMEYLFRYMDGDRYDVTGTNPGDTTTSSFNRYQAGFYAQLIMRASTRWRFGLRADLMHLNREKNDGADIGLPENLYRLGAMTDYSPTEFSRFRLQYNWDRSRFTGTKRENNHEVILQCNVSIGAHGAHSF